MRGQGFRGLRETLPGSPNLKRKRDFLGENISKMCRKFFIALLKLQKLFATKDSEKRAKQKNKIRVRMGRIERKLGYSSLSFYKWVGGRDVAGGD